VEGGEAAGAVTAGDTVATAGVVAASDVAAGAASPPALPGVYAFRDRDGRLLYVGVSGSLARRVCSYFAPGHARGTKAARIARLAATVEWRTAGSHLEALVLEARTIRSDAPHFNRRLKQTGGYAWIRFDARDPFPRLEVARRLEDGPYRYVGPFPGGRRLARGVAAIADGLGLRTCPGTLAPDPAAPACLRLDLGQCAAPCIARVGAGDYGRRLARALGALAGGHPEVARQCGARAGRPLPLPAALAGTRAALGAARRTERVLVVVPAAGRPGHRLLALGGGILRGAFAAPDATALRPALERTLASLAPPPPAILPREQLDEVRIVTAWLAGAEGRAAAVDVDRVGAAGAWAHVRRRTAHGPLFAAAAVRSPARRSPE
jgi:hypothetical protein